MPELVHHAGRARARPPLAVALVVALAMGCSGSGAGGSPYAVTVSVPSLEFTARYGTPTPPSQTITASFTGDGLVVGTLPGTSVPPWLSVGRSGLTGKTATFTVAISTTQMTPGTQRTTLRFVTGRADQTDLTWVDVPVAYTIAEDLAVSPASPRLTVNAGSGEPPQALAVSLASTKVAVPWTAAVDPGLVLSATAGAAGTPVVVSYDVRAQPLPPGTATLNVRVTSEIAGAPVTKVVPVTVDVAPHRIYAVRNGVALTSVPGVSKLAATVPLGDSAGVATGTWSASADQPWLVVDGIAGDAVSFHADPSGLVDGLYLATLSVSSTGARVEGPARARVGLYVSGAAPVQGLLASDAGRGPVADPVRPWVWVRPPGDSTRAVAYNVYSGAIEKVLTFPVVLYGFGISGDGSTMYAGGWPPGGGTYSLVRLAIDTGAALTPLVGPGDPVVGTLRAEGLEFLITDRATFLDATTGAAASTGTYVFAGGDWTLTAAADQPVLYGISAGTSPTLFGRARYAVSGHPARLTFSEPSSARSLEPGGIYSLAATPDGSAFCFPFSGAFRVYAPGASQGLVPGASFPTSTPTDGARAVDIARDGRVVAAGNTTVDCYVALLGTRTSSHPLPAGISVDAVRLSSDGERAVVMGFASGSTQTLWAYPAR